MYRMSLESLRAWEVDCQKENKREIFHEVLEDILDHLNLLGCLGTGVPSIPSFLSIIYHPRFFFLPSLSSGSFGMVIPPFDNNHEGYVFCHLFIWGAKPPR